MKKLETMIDSINWTATEYCSPHEYFRRDQNPAAFDYMCSLIDTYGKDEKFYKTTYRYLYVGEWKYWHFQIILNRAKISLKP